MGEKRSASVALLFKENSIGTVELLVGKRKPSGEYGPPGGKRQDGETAEECMVRELEEETGLIARVWKYECTLVEEDGFSLDIFSVRLVDGKLENREVDKCDGWEWLSLYFLGKSKTIWCIKELIERKLLEAPKLVYHVNDNPPADL